jgi:hypothetical protein
MWEELFPGEVPPPPRMVYIGSQLEEAALIFQKFWMTHEEEVLNSVLSMKENDIDCTIDEERLEGHGYTREAMAKMVESIVSRLSSQAKKGQGIKDEPQSPIFEDQEMLLDAGPEFATGMVEIGGHTMAAPSVMFGLPHSPEWQHPGNQTHVWP